VLNVVPKEKVNEINPKGGFHNYGILRNDCIILKGSIPGVVKRLVRLRLAIRKRAIEDIKASIVI